MDISLAVKRKHPDINNVCLGENVTHNGLNYRTGMILAYGSLAGLPEFTEIIQTTVVRGKLLFLVWKLSTWNTSGPMN